MTAPRRAGLAALAAGLAVAALAPAAAGRDADLVRAHRAAYPAAEHAAARASGSEGVQVAYDAARDLQEALRASGVVSAPCRPLRRALTRYAAGRVLQMEGVDRPSAADARRGRAAAEGARSLVRSSGPACRGVGGGPAPARLAMSPGPGEAFFGAVVARVPPGTDAATLFLDGAAVARAAARAGRVRFALDGPEGRHDLRIDAMRAGRVVHGNHRPGVWLLGANSRRAMAGSRTGQALSAALARATASGPRYRAAWVQDLSSGEAAGVNADALFPATSTVKLGLMAGALERTGSGALLSAYDYDFRAIAGWSSNLATNRLLRRLGGAATARDGLRRLDAQQSTFPGEYLVGTELQPALPGGGATAPPPRVSERVTTARDLARMLYAIHATAARAPGSRSQTGLSAGQGRLLLGWLLASEQRGDNRGLFAAGAPPGALIAQKNGWIRSTRLGAALVYAPRGPVIVVVAAHDASGVALSQATALGTRIGRLSRP